MIRYKLILILFVLCSITFISTGETTEKLYYAGPTDIPHVTREMKTPGFWIGRIDQPDKLLMNREEINRFNLRVKQDLKLIKDLLRVPEVFNGRQLKEEIRSRLDSVKADNNFDDQSQRASDEFYERMHERMAIDHIKDEITVKYGLIVHYADQRFLPTTKGLYAMAGDIDFDELQNSALDIATPVVILHESADSKWWYVLSRLSDGWVESARVATCDRSVFESYLSSTVPVIVTAAKADLYLDKTLTQFYDHARMGATFAAVKIEHDGVQAVLLPTRTDDGRLRSKTAFIKNDQASKGYLPFTPRTIIEQAFKLQSAPYGWGGMHGEQDCSRLLQEVYATVGITLPRDSKNQAKVGHQLFTFDKETPDKEKVAALNGLSPEGIVLTMRGHIMIYLGTVNQRPYAIHAFWGYREPTPDGDRVRVVNRTAVSDLFLGERSKKGSLINRLEAIMAMRNQ